MLGTSLSSTGAAVVLLLLVDWAQNIFVKNICCFKAHFSLKWQIRKKSRICLQVWCLLSICCERKAHKDWHLSQEEPTGCDVGQSQERKLIWGKHLAKQFWFQNHLSARRLTWKQGKPWERNDLPWICHKRIWLMFHAVLH